MYKDIRPVIQRGRLYRLASVLHGPFGASQYVAGDDVVVLGWWGPRQCGVRYRDTGSGRQHWGSALMAEGLELPAETETASTFGSTLVRLVRLLE